MIGKLPQGGDISIGSRIYSWKSKKNNQLKPGQRSGKL